MSTTPIGEHMNWRHAAGQIKIDGYDPKKHKWVTQIGSGTTFREQPRWNRERALSVLTGKNSATEAVQTSFRRKPRPKDTVRFFRIGDLVIAGYFPHPAPHLPHNPNHGCIRAPIIDDDLELHQAWWAHPERVRLHALARP
jgi:hypothetical protein